MAPTVDVLIVVATAVEARVVIDAFKLRPGRWR